MKVKVDHDLCIGCGSCAMIAKEVFEMRKGKSYVKEGVKITPEMEETVKLATQACPVGAINVSDQ